MAKEKIIVTFETIADAMALESLCQKQQISGRLIPTPRSLSAGCGISWYSEVSEEAHLLQLINHPTNGQVVIVGQVQRI